MIVATEIPAVTFSKEQYSKEWKCIELNMNDNLWFHELLSEYEVSHRRLIPTIHVTSPTGKMQAFDSPSVDMFGSVRYEGVKGTHIIFKFK